MPESPSSTIRMSGTGPANTEPLHRRTRPAFRRGRTPRNIPFRKVQGTTIVPPDSTVIVTCRRVNVRTLRPSPLRCGDPTGPGQPGNTLRSLARGAGTDVPAQEGTTWRTRSRYG